jgi:Protein of unknown function (DUF3152)
VGQYLKDVLSLSASEPRCRLVLVPVSQLPGASRDGVRPHRATARQASRSELSTQSNSHHPGHLRSDPSASIGRARQRRRSAIGLLAGIVGLGLVGLCLRTVPTVLTNTSLIAEVAEPLVGIPINSPMTTTPTVEPSMSIKPTTEVKPSVRPAKLQAKRRPKGIGEVMVPESGPGTYQGAHKALRSKSSSGALIRYDVRVEDGLSIDADEAAELIQGVLDDKRSWRGTGRWRFELTPVGGAGTLHAYIVTPETTDRLCAPYLTRGEVSCQNGNRVVLNAKRWQLGVDAYGADLTNYRRYLVNHEFGHALGKRHVNCPGAGKLAPVMMQQTKGLGACRKNSWPLASEN